jgi:hypothetical protein
MNGINQKIISIPLHFLKTDKNYEAAIVEDHPNDPAAVKVGQQSFKKNDVISLTLASGGGYIAMFKLK